MRSALIQSGSPARSRSSMHLFVARHPRLSRYRGYRNYRGYIGVNIGVKLGLHRDNGEENGHYYLGFRV